MCNVTWPDPDSVLSTGHQCVLDSYHTGHHRCKCGEELSRAKHAYDNLTPELIFDLGQWMREVITYDANAQVVENLARDFGLVLEREKLIEEKRRTLALELSRVFRDAVPSDEAPSADVTADGLFAVLAEIDRRANQLGAAVDEEEA